MAIKASCVITISKYRDTDSITRYYKLQASTASAPAKPTTLTPSGWSTTEPTYTSGSTNTLYFTDRYVFSDGTFQYTDVSESSSYEAAKEAYNKAQAAQDTANTTQENLDNLEIGGRNFVENTSNEWSDWWTIETTDTPIANRTYVANSLDLTKLNLKPNDILSLQVEIETSGFEVVDGKTTSLWAQGDVNGKWSGTDGYFINPWMNIVSINNIANFNKTNKYTKVYTIPASTITVMEQYGGNIKLGFRCDYASKGAQLRYRCIKIEKGNKVTDWTPAPEDIENALDLEISQTKTDLEQNISDSIYEFNENLMGEEGEITKIKEDLASKVNETRVNELTNDAIEAFKSSKEYTAITKYLEGMIAALTVNEDGYQIMKQGEDGGFTFEMGNLYEDIKKIQDSLTDMSDWGDEYSLNDAKGYIRMKKSDDGNPVLILGATTSPFQVRITNTSIDFLQNDIPIAYANNKAFFSPKSIVEEEIRIINNNNNNNSGFVWKTRENGNLGLSWTSGEE